MRGAFSFLPLTPPLLGTDAGLSVSAGRFCATMCAAFDTWLHNSNPRRPSAHMHIPLNHPYLLLTLCTLFWSGNFVLSRAMHSEIPPIGLSFWRWAVAAIIILPWVWRPIRDQLPLIAHHWKRMTLLALLGVSGFNTFVYLGLQTTTATNAVLLQSSLPLQIVALNWLIYRRRTRWLEAISILISLLGIGLILGRGDPIAVFAGQWVVGDLWILAAVLVWALYSIFLQWRPPSLAPLACLGFTLIVGAAALLPLWLFELAGGRVIQATPNTVLTVAYVAVFPSILAYLFWNTGVSATGPSTAGHFAHLMPVFGSLMAVIFLGENFGWYHAGGAALVALAIGLSVWSRRTYQTIDERGPHRRR